MFEMTTLEILKTIYVALTGGCLSGGAIVAYFFINLERNHKIEHNGGN